MVSLMALLHRSRDCGAGLEKEVMSGTRLGWSRGGSSRKPVGFSRTVLTGWKPPSSRKHKWVSRTREGEGRRVRVGDDSLVSQKSVHVSVQREKSLLHFSFKDSLVGAKADAFYAHFSTATHIPICKCWASGGGSRSHRAAKMCIWPCNQGGWRYITVLFFYSLDAAGWPNID